MFSGIVEQIGEIIALSGNSTDRDFLIKANFPELKIGDSVSVNGACLTAREISNENFLVTASNETLKLTNLGKLTIGSQVNLETSLTLNKPIGGHLIQGHISGNTQIIHLNKIGEAIYCQFKMPSDLNRYIVAKGYIAIDGMSLTIVNENQDFFEIMLIPHTLAHTIAKNYHIGTVVNLEIDIIARYLEKFYAK